MKYYSWKLDWSTQEGTDPTNQINSDDVRLEPHFTVGEPTDPNSITYGYLVKGSVDLDQLSKWSMAEVTVDDMLNAAQTLKNEAYIENGLIVFPPMPEPAIQKQD